jgi:FkbM family methyltransferase
MRRVLHALIGAVPAPVLRWLGRVQFKVPLLRRLLSRVSAGVVSGEVTISKGLTRRMKMDATGAHPGYALETTEPVLQAALGDHLRPGDVFYDLGASVGFFTLLAAKLVGPDGAVVAFEPDPRNAAVLRANVERDGLGNVTVVEQGVSRASGSVRFAMVDSTASHFARGGEAGIEVPVTSLDDFLARGGHRPPTLVKLDIEGEEVRALRGARGLLTGVRPTVISGVHQTEQTIREPVSATGYSLTMLEDEGEAPDEGTCDDPWNPHLLGVPDGAA